MVSSYLDSTSLAGPLGRMLAQVEIPGVRFAVLLSEDGLAITHSPGINIDLADRVAAAAAGLRSLTKAMAELCGSAPATVRQSITEYNGGLIFIGAAKPGMLLAVATTADVDVALIAHRLTELAAREQKLAGTATTR